MGFSMNETSAHNNHSNPSPAKIIAMWSGPRNLSTAMMRSFGSRDDCHAIDEPFYAAYLKATGLQHPMREEIIADGETDPAKIVEACLKAPVAPYSLVYQKHMTHHMIDSFDLSWISKVTNVFLIREPKRVLASYAAKSENVTGEDLGFRKQREIFNLARDEFGAAPVVVDAHAIRENPEGMLRKLCEVIHINFDPAMLRWEKGPKPEDGIWASHWYDAVWNSTGFSPPEKAQEVRLSASLQRIEEEVLPDYRHMQQFCLQA